MTAINLGVDIGGTFTDVVLEVGERLHSTKVLTTYAAPEEAILAGLAQVCAQADVEPARITRILHGTTLATNALIERKGAKTAFITTDGFRDVIEMRTESRFEQYDLNLVLPDPLIARDCRFTLHERVDAGGNVLIPLDDAEVEALAARLEDFDSIAIGFLHSYANPEHEHRVADILAARFPAKSLSLSSEVSPQIREYERFNTTCANAYVRPMMADYLGRLKARLAEAGADCPVFLMHSGGGLMSLEAARQFPVRLVESGPAGGAIFAADLARRHGLDRVLSFDMGGTTAKICLIRGGTPKTARVFEVARTYRFKKGSGMPISIPVIDMVEIGAGGGSLGSVDALGRIQAGPESAGSEPGPAAYGRGGSRPAVTDADLILGRLDPDNFAGGSIPLKPEASETALAEHIGQRLDLDALTAAYGLSEMVDENMANAARVHAVENGEDLAGYTMIAFGGAAPLHAGRLCEKLGLTRLLVPPGAGVGSAIGFLRAPYAYEATRSLVMRLDAFDAEAARELLAALRDEAESFVRDCAPEADISTETVLHMRYRGQGWDIPVPLPDRLEAGAIQEAFEAAYSNLFGRTVAGLVPEVTVWALSAATPLRPIEPVAGAPAGETATGTERQLFDASTGALAAAGALERTALGDGTVIAGPAIVTEAETTIIVPRGFTAKGRADGTIDIRKSS
ncbi:hydantoin utilization protein [Oceanicola granulosus HTCC2516]|uniref:Hydantoin utilization protein n=1 Tax=Oceanicola granulosus (strain ATCC BAA-861 / DSM 15982 / KCTC 12143 / HTCC2516) TaxID=314256 RepID=Q2CI81_OCEGH|nr:hydantoinase/oxoprolinase family protein [Oceanicola granulosus]EAR52377.1 hydantoin utilization protein [Oceanicola granulosus HTCC2516]